MASRAFRSRCPTLVLSGHLGRQGDSPLSDVLSIRSHSLCGIGVSPDAVAKLRIRLDSTHGGPRKGLSFGWGLTTASSVSPASLPRSWRRPRPADVRFAPSAGSLLAGARLFIRAFGARDVVLVPAMWHAPARSGAVCRGDDRDFARLLRTRRFALDGGRLGSGKNDESPGVAWGLLRPCCAGPQLGPRIMCEVNTPADQCFRG